MSYHDLEERHWHQWKAGAGGPYGWRSPADPGRVGQYADCECGAQVFVGDDEEPVVFMRPDRRRPHAMIPREAVTIEP